MQETPITILVVEDDALIRLGAVSFIEDAGFQVLEASNADDALAMLERHAGVQLVFTDVDMPGSMDGIKLAHYISTRWPPIHLIVASGKPTVLGMGLPTGATFFAKPYLESAVLKEVARKLNEISPGL